MLNKKKILAFAMSAMITFAFAGCSKNNKNADNNVTTTAEKNSSSATGKVELKNYEFPEFLKNIKTPDMLSLLEYTNFEESQYISDVEEQPFDNITCDKCINVKLFTYKNNGYTGLLDQKGNVLIEADKYTDITVASSNMLRLSYSSELKVADDYVRFSDRGTISEIITNYQFAAENINKATVVDSEDNTEQYQLVLPDGSVVVNSDGISLWDSAELVNIADIRTSKVYKAYYKLTYDRQTYYVGFDSVYNYWIYEGPYASIQLKVGDETGQCYVLGFDDYSELNKMISSFGSVSARTTPSKDQALDYIQITLGSSSSEQTVMTISADGFCFTESVKADKQYSNKYFSCLDRESFVSLVKWVEQVLSEEYPLKD